MNDVTIIIPVLNKDLQSENLKNAVNSVNECQKHYTNGTLKVLIVTDKNEDNPDYINFEGVDCQYILNESGNYDFCSQVNFAVDKVETEYFSILEFDDEYKPKWFKFANQYQYGNEDVSIFLPINIVTDVNSEHWQYANEMPLATPDPEEFGFIDEELLNVWTGFNLTGAIFNTADFIKVGKYKPSIKVAFNYELMLRMVNKKLKLYVVPKEGYVHVIGRKGSLTETYTNEIPADEIKLWFELAKREYTYDHDRNKGVTIGKKVNLS
jgi:glycosyltransferase involved in cell wall biosynthesis